MTVRRVARFVAAILFTSACAQGLAQSCIKQEVLDELEKLPSCKVVRADVGDSPTLLTSLRTDEFCRVAAEQILAGANIVISSAADPTAVEGACLTLVLKDEKQPQIVARLPKNAASPLWQVKSDQNSTKVQIVPADLPGFKVTVNQPVVQVYGVRATEIQVPLARSVTVNYGAVRVESVAPTVPGTNVRGLDIALPASSQPEFSTLRVTLANEYGQRGQFVVSLVSEEAYSDSPTLQSLKIELAHVRKLAADERFMRTRAAEDGTLQAQDAAVLQGLYKLARATLPPCGVNVSSCADLSRAQLATEGLLRADIDYRMFLLEKQMTFWGGFRTLRPTTPHRELIKLRNLLDKFTEANNRMEKWQFRTQDKSGRMQELNAEKAYVQGQIKAEELNAEIAAIDVNRWQRLKASNAATKAAVEQEISNVSDRMEKLAQQQEALGEQATSLAINLAASVAGVPVDAVAGLAEGDLKKAVVSYVGSELADPSSALSTELQSFGDALVEANGALKDLRETYKDIKELERNVDLVAVAIREPSMERFLKVGELAYSSLNDEQKMELDRLIEKHKPVQAWIQSSYHTVIALEGEIEGYRTALKVVAKEMNNLPKTVHEEVRVLLNQELKKAVSRGEQSVRETAARMLDGLKDLRLQGKAAEGALVNALAVYPTFVAEANIDLWKAVKERYPGINDEQVAAQFFAAASETLALSADEREAKLRKTGLGFGFDGTFVIEVSGRRRVFRVESDILRSAARVDPKRVRVEAQDKLQSLVHTLHDRIAPEQMMSYVAACASPEGASAFISKFVSKEKAARMWENLKALPAELRAEVEPGVRHAMAASLAGPAVPQPVVPPLPAGVAIPSASAQEQMQNQMAAMALNAAFPGAGTALQLAQTFGSMDANRELHDQLTKQSAQLISAYQELLRSSEDADFSEAISLKENARAIALSEAAKAQLEQYNGTIDTILDATRDADARLRLYRPYFFYLSEMLRQQFDVFDRSLAMWSGATDSRGFFASRIAIDPSLARLALDSEIHLFDWLNRDREATKTDPFMLFVHWQQLVTLAENYCADHGCKPGDTVLGQIGATHRLRALENLATPGTREQFARWKRGSLSEPFAFRITIDPSRQLVPVRYLNVRNLDWNIIPVKQTGSLAGTHVEVRHLGHARIPYEQRSGSSTVIRFRDESMLSTTFMPSNREAGFDIAELAGRFQTQYDLASLQPLRGVEGWGLYGTYELTIANVDAVRDVEDFEIEIAYIYTDPRNITSERSFLAAATSADIGGCEMQKADDTARSSCRTVFYFAKDDCGTTPRASSHRWVNPDAGLEYLYAMQQAEASSGSLKLCKTSTHIPIAKTGHGAAASDVAVHVNQGAR